MTDWTSLNYVVVDVEGNGLQPPDLVELATVPIVGGVIGEARSWLVCPERPISGFATSIHGITNSMVETAPMFGAIKDEVRQVLDGSALIAHNAHVDVDVLQRSFGEWESAEIFDTLKLARRLLPKQSTYRLGALVAAFSLNAGLSAKLRPHRATYDAIVTARLFVTLARTTVGEPRSLEALRGQVEGGDVDEPESLF